MPKLLLAVAEAYDSVTRAVSCDVTRQLFAWTGLPADTPILYPSAHGTVQQPGSELLQEALKTELAFNDQVSVEVDEIIEQDRILSTAVQYPDKLFIFRDPRVETILKPVYSSTEIAINFKFSSIDEVNAKRWREQMRVHNQVIRLRGDTSPYNPDQLRKHYSLSANFFEHFEGTRPRRDAGGTGNCW